MHKLLRQIPDLLESTLRASVQGLAWCQRFSYQQTRHLLDLVFPPQCVLCCQELVELSTYQICSQCLSNFSLGDIQVCKVCSMPLTPSQICISCRDRKYRFQETRALSTYRGQSREAILQMKRAGQEPIALALGEVLADRLRERPFDAFPNVLVPVPTHWLKRWQRGGNPPELLCEAMAHKLHLPVVNNAIRFRRRTRKQGTLLPAERQRNLREALEVVRAHRVAGKDVLLVDDVMTTGATVNTLARLLLRCGSLSVRVAVIARATG